MHSSVGAISRVELQGALLVHPVKVVDFSRHSLATRVENIFGRAEADRRRWRSDERFSAAPALRSDMTPAHSPQWASARSDNLLGGLSDLGFVVLDEFSKRRKSTTGL